MKNYKMESAYPDFKFEKATDISPVDLKMMGVKAVAVDLDNTTVAFTSVKPEEGVKEWIRQLRASGIKVIIVTNTFASRAFLISRLMGNVPFLPWAFKPNTYALKAAANILNVDISEIAMIGDQLFTDVLSANRVGAVSVKVEPIGEKPFFSSYYEKKRELERLYMEQYESDLGMVKYGAI